MQHDIISSILAGRDTLALMPTGGGKSLCFQVPALVLNGLTIVVSPLIALMQDQVSRLQQMGVAAACLHSGMHYNEVKQMLASAVEGAYKLLYISPERLQTRTFKDYLQEMEVSLVAVDEAHCISQWGHDFRPAYTGIASIRDFFPRVPILALTATATPLVQQDIATQLGMSEPAVFKMSFARDNIFYQVNYSDDKNADTVQGIGDACTIVYCRSRRQTETTGAMLSRNGRNAAVYHAGLARARRDEAQQMWMENRCPVMVATTAFGMGIDKPDVRTVVHYDAPEHLEGYYQEAGRAGRDGQPSRAVAFYNSGDIQRLRESTALQYPPDAYLRQVYQAVVEYLQVPISAQPDRYFSFDLADFCSKFKLLASHAVHALKLLEREGLWTMTDAVYSPATVQFTADRHTLDGLYDINPRLGFVSVGLLRMYNSIFHYPTAIRETAVARQLKMQADDVVRCLEQLAAMGVLEYSRPGEGPQLFFHHYRVDSRHLIINHKRINKLRQQHDERTEAMISFLENQNVCRQQLLLRYFGEQLAGDCGHCDVCSRRQRKPLNEVALRNDLLKHIKQHSDLQLNTLISSYPAADAPDVISTLRRMIDEGVVLLVNNVLHAK